MNRPPDNLLQDGSIAVQRVGNRIAVAGGPDISQSDPRLNIDVGMFDSRSVSVVLRISPSGSFSVGLLDETPRPWSWWQRLLRRLHV